mmetsp:Transcript_18369/g.22798  ORF Transcript_18369/g.22798 Transcript_18369/m.22798 type:complete len:140 (-) Transcript_18369:41-460(-)
MTLFFNHICILGKANIPQLPIAGLIGLSQKYTTVHDWYHEIAYCGDELTEVLNELGVLDIDAKASAIRFIFDGITHNLNNSTVNAAVRPKALIALKKIKELFVGMGIYGMDLWMTEYNKFRRTLKRKQALIRYLKENGL